MGFRPGVPAVTVQCAFGSDPNTNPAGWTWTTITGRVTAIDMDRCSRSDELGTYQAGNATISMLNTDGALNPTNAGGPWFGQLRPFVPIRVQTTLSGSTATRWQGFVRQWPQAWSDPALGIARIACVDAYAPLNQIDLDAAYAAEVLLDSPTVYYPMGEASGASTAGNASGNAYPPAQIIHTKQINTSTPGAYAFGQAMDVVGAAAQTGLQLTGHNNNGGGGTEDGYLLNLPNFPLNWASFTLECWVQMAASPAQECVVWALRDASHVGNTGIPTPSGDLRFVQIHGFSAEWFSTTPFPFNNDHGGPISALPDLTDGNLHHLVVTWSVGGSGSTATTYVDGVAVLAVGPTGSDIGLTGTFTMACQVGGIAFNAQTMPSSAYPADGEPMIGTVAHFAAYNTALSAARIAAHYQAGLNAFADELSGARATRLLKYGGWQTAAQTIQAGRSTMSPASGLAGNSLLAELQNVVDAEQGTLTVTADGKVDFRGRDDRMLQTTPTITFGSNIAGGEIPYSLPDLGLSLEDTLIVDDFQISRPGGITAESADGVAIGHFFPRSKQITMDVDSDDQVQYAADWLLERESEPTQRLQQIVIDAANFNPASFPGPGLWSALLGMDLHKRARMNHKPMNAPLITVDGFIEQVHDVIDFNAGTWQITTWISPVLSDYWILEDPVQGVIDSTYLIAF